MPKKVIRENEYKTSVVYTEYAGFPSVAKLVTIKQEKNPYEGKKVKGIFGDDTTILEAYEVKIKEGTRSVQPKGSVEVAFQIPEGYEDATLSVALVDKEHDLKTLETRRDGKVLYASVNKLGNYVIIGPERENIAENTFPYLQLLEIVAGATLLFGIFFFVSEKIKKYYKNK